jgi:hypothetical protein
MRIRRILCFILPLTFLSFMNPARLDARYSNGGSEANDSAESGFSEPTASGFEYHSDDTGLPEYVVVSRPTNGGIREAIPERFKGKYEVWKSEFLSTELGRRQWETYANNAGCVLTIAVSQDNRHGASSGKYKWDDTGQLVAATITLGSRLDDGYPNPIYYPVMNSLAPPELSYVVGGNVLAATKIAHEFGHVNRTASSNGERYLLQSQLIPQYNRILLSNGRNTRDPRLVELARQMGGTPVEIWEDGEYWGEANAMLYLRDRLTKENLRCSLFTRIKRTVALYAENYAERFDRIAQSSAPACSR